MFLTHKVDLPPGHSPLGGSSAARFLACPGSVNFSKGMPNGSSEYAKLGTAAHALAEKCLRKRVEAWEYIQEYFEGVEVDSDMAEAVQVYLDYAASIYMDASRKLLKEQKDYTNLYSAFEYPFFAESLHPLMRGYVDCVFLNVPARELHIIDYKHGIGVVTPAKGNIQLMYYAAGVLEVEDLWGRVDTVKMTIVQPRAYHFEGPIRTATIAEDDLRGWVHGTLVPGMKAAEISTQTQTGQHCRFCPARSKACPAMVENDRKVAKMINEWENDRELSEDFLGSTLTMLDTADIRKKALKDEALARLNDDKKVPGWKLVTGKSRRVWKEGVVGPALNTFGSQCWVSSHLVAGIISAMGIGRAQQHLKVTDLLSPAQVEKLPGGLAFTARWAAKVPAGHALAPEHDGRRAISTSTKSLFKPVKKV